MPITEIAALTEDHEAQQGARRSGLNLDRIRQAFSSPRFPIVVALLAIVLAAPSLRQGWVADDLLHRKMLLTLSLSDLMKGLFVFIDPDHGLQHMDLSTELGTIPWWGFDEVRIAFYRPLTVLTHWLDYRLWPNNRSLMHLQSVLWYGGVCALAALLFRRVMVSKWVAGLASFLFAVDIVHLGTVAWLANRNALMSMFFGLLALLSHDLWRRDGRRAGMVLAPVWFTLALLSGEAGIAAAAYLAAYAAFLEHGKWRHRIASLLPYGILVVLWRLGYQMMGYGASGSGFYIDPVRDPLRFAEKAVELVPVLFTSQWLGQVPIFYNLLSQPAMQVTWLFAGLFLLLALLVFVPILRRDRVARFWATGMMLALLPASAVTLLSGRVLIFASLGAMGLIAQLVGNLLDGSDLSSTRRLWRIPAWTMGALLIFLHGVLAPVLMPVLAMAPNTFQTVIADVTDIGPLPRAAEQDVVVLNAPSPFNFIYLPSLWLEQNRPMPAHLRILAPGYSAVDITRLDEQTLLVRPEYGYLVQPGSSTGDPEGSDRFFHMAYMYQLLEKFFRDQSIPLIQGQTVTVPGARFEVTEMTVDGRPQEAQVMFDVPLDDQSLVWLQWNWEQARYVPASPPRVGQTVRIPGPF